MVRPIVFHVRMEVAMSLDLNRRDFLRQASRTGLGAAAAFGGPLTAFAARVRAGENPVGEGYGPLYPKGELALPHGFNYRVVSRQGELMDDGHPTPGAFDGMAAFAGAGQTTVLIRNHENRGLPGEVPVIVPPELAYDNHPTALGGNTKLVLSQGQKVERQFAVLGGTDTNCAGGRTPWGSWITCEETLDVGNEKHGYIFEIPAEVDEPIKAVPIRQAGRFVHEAVVWLDGALYETEDRRDDSSLFRYLPDSMPRRAGDLRSSTGRLQAMRIPGRPDAVMDVWPVGRPTPVEWFDIRDPENAPLEARAGGAAVFDRQEGMWTGAGKIYFDCTEGGVNDHGQIWELDPSDSVLTLIYESPGPEELEGPDNLCVVPKTGDLMLCEDSNPPQYLRGLTTDGAIYDFAHSIANESEFCGACFDPKGEVLYVNQQTPGVTYAIWGPWKRRRGR